LFVLLSYPLRAIVVAGDNPGSAVVSYNEVFGGVNLNGVVEITDNEGGCSGSLLADGTSILTAGHCVTTAYGAPIYSNIAVSFMGPDGTVVESVSSVQVDPGYTGNSTLGSDLAVLTLSQPAPSFAVGYALFTGSQIPSIPVVIAGYGVGGTGTTGANLSFGTLRVGENEYEGNGLEFFGWSSQLLVGQFYDPSHTATNVLGVAHPYYSTNEVDISFGDSGGPSFYDGEIIGVHDLVICEGSSSCDDPPAEGTANDSYFGQMFADTSVADNLTFIEDAEAPEPASCSLVLLGLAAAGILRRRTRRRLS
jgi:hypothetical protein